MKIDDRAFVGIEYSLSLDDGDTVDHSDPGDPLGFIFGMNQVVPGLESNLKGLEPGADVKFTVEPGDGYGEPNPLMVKTLSRDQFPDDLELQPGMVFQANGSGSDLVFQVKEVTDKDVVVDFNHPLAGQRLHFEIKVVTVRDATEEELAAAEHECGDGGCEHSHGGCGGGCA